MVGKIIYVANKLMYVGNLRSASTMTWNTLMVGDRSLPEELLFRAWLRDESQQLGLALTRDKKGVDVHKTFQKIDVLEWDTHLMRILVSYIKYVGMCEYRFSVFQEEDGKWDYYDRLETDEVAYLHTRVSSYEKAWKQALNL